MNSFFASIGKRLADKITTTWPSCNSSTDFLKSQFQLAELEESFVPRQLLALKTNKAIGLDKISARLLKNSAHTIALSVTKLLNLSIKMVNFLNCGNVLKLQPYLSQGTGQMHQTTDLSLFCLYTVLPVPGCFSQFLTLQKCHTVEQYRRWGKMKALYNFTLVAVQIR